MMSQSAMHWQKVFKRKERRLTLIKSTENDELARLFDLARQEDLIEDGIDLVKIENEIEFADVSEKGIEHLDKEVDRFEVGQLVVVGIDAYAEKETGIASIDDLVISVL